MSWTFAANLSATAALTSEGFYNILATAKAAGWTCPKDSDGTTYSATGGQLTHGLTGAGGMCNSQAWFVMRDPAGKRSFCIQRDTTQGTIYTARLKYSPAAGFVGGSPSATQVPSATDEVVLQGGGTDAAPTFSEFFPIVNVPSWRQYMGFGDASVGYSFWHIAPGNNSFTNVNAHFVLDVLKAGSYPTANTDPAVIWAPNMGNSGGGNGTSNFFVAPTTFMYGRSKAFVGAIASANFLGVMPMSPYGEALIFQSSAAGNAIGVGNGFSGKDFAFNMIYGRPSGQATATGFLGVSSILKFTTLSRQIGDMLMKTTLGDYLCIGSNVIVPWNGTLLRLQ